MWVERTPEEQDAWQRSAIREASAQGRVIAIIVWAVGTLLLAGGWGFAGSAGGWLTSTVIVGVVMVPVAYVAFLWESGNERAQQRARTICPRCEIAGVANAGAACSCGGTYVQANTVKWVEPAGGSSPAAPGRGSGPQE